jgi:ribonuclease Y
MICSLNYIILEHIKQQIHGSQHTINNYWSAALIVGIIAGKFIFAKNTKKIVEDAELQSKTFLKEAELRAETIRKEKELEVKEKFIQLKAAHDKEVNDRNRKDQRKREPDPPKRTVLYPKKRVVLISRSKRMKAIKENLNRQIDLVNIKRSELEKHQEEHIRRLEKIAGLSAEEAKSQLVESLKSEAHTQALAMQQEIIDTAKEKGDQRSQENHHSNYSTNSSRTGY